MLYVLSPAKKLDYDTPIAAVGHTQPQFIEDAQALIAVLKAQSADEVARLMNLSPALAQLNVARYAAWSPSFTLANARPAVLAFNGDVYEGLDAQTLSAHDLEWAQTQVAILSGLYGVLRPLDLMQPYRLEMGTRLATPRGANLYTFWGARIAQSLNASLRAQGGEPMLINLASEEYFKSVDRKVLDARVVQCVFQDWKNGAWKVISFHAKRARGLMARYAISERINDPAGLCGFASEGYRWDEAASSVDRLVFRRRLD